MEVVLEEVWNNQGLPGKVQVTLSRRSTIENSQNQACLSALRGLLDRCLRGECRPEPYQEANCKCVVEFSPDIPSLIDAIQSDDVESRVIAGGHLVRLGQLAVPFLANVVIDVTKPSLIRKAVINYLADIGPESAESVPALISALQEPAPILRNAASIALVAIGEAALPPLLKALAADPLTAKWGDDAYVCIQLDTAIHMLSALGPQALAAVIGDKTQPLDLRMIAADVLRQKGASARDAVSTLENVATDVERDISERENAKDALAAIDRSAFSRIASLGGASSASRGRLMKAHVDETVVVKLPQTGHTHGGKSCVFDYRLGEPLKSDPPHLPPNERQPPQESGRGIPVGSDSELNSMMKAVQSQLPESDLDKLATICAISDYFRHELETAKRLPTSAQIATREARMGIARLLSTLPEDANEREMLLTALDKSFCRQVRAMSQPILNDLLHAEFSDYDSTKTASREINTFLREAHAALRVHGSATLCSVMPHKSRQLSNQLLAPSCERCRYDYRSCFQIPIRSERQIARSRGCRGSSGVRFRRTARSHLSSHGSFGTVLAVLYDHRPTTQALRQHLYFHTDTAETFPRKTETIRLIPAESLLRLVFSVLRSAIYVTPGGIMADQKELSGSQVAGAVIGGVVGNVKGTSVGAALALAAAPFLGPFAILLLPVVAAAGTVAGVRMGSKGLGRAAVMAVCTGGLDLLPGADLPASDAIAGGGHSPSST
jgi:hypothetical protein